MNGQSMKTGNSSKLRTYNLSDNGIVSVSIYPVLEQKDGLIKTAGICIHESELNIIRNFGSSCSIVTFLTNTDKIIEMMKEERKKFFSNS